MRTHCGLVAAAAACRCARRIAPATASGRVDPARLMFVRKDAADQARTERATAEMDELHRVASIYRAHPDYEAPERLTRAVRELLASGTFHLLQ
jgi:hypothetical protein